MKRIIVLLLLIGLCLPCFAEKVLWNDEYGNLVQTETVKQKNGIEVQYSTILQESEEYLQKQAADALVEDVRQEQQDIQAMIQQKAKDMAQAELIKENKIELKDGKLKIKK